ncbi:MAG: hypothetical protein F6K65_18540 [Moorea sp. SIO3C2]|nr:hypothetical protein [Moorena sp. SIO3C2]
MSIQGRSYSSFGKADATRTGLPASSADASTRGARLLALVLLSVHRQTSVFRRRIFLRQTYLGITALWLTSWGKSLPWLC